MPPGGSAASPQSAVQFTETDALIDTGAQRTVLSPEAVRKAGLSKINEADLRVVGAIVRADVYVASLEFPLCGLKTIEVIEVSCCELPHILYHCLLGRDVLSRWVFTYDGPDGTWEITEGRAAGWVEPPEGIDPNLWGE
ncbi:MAG: retropepsin-like aspartic protease [Terriglobales bacterium]